MTSAAIVVTGTLRGTGYATRITSMISSYVDAGLDIDLFHFRFPHEQVPYDSVMRVVSAYVPFEMRLLRKINHLGLRPAVMTRVNKTSRRRLRVDKTYDLVQAERTDVWGAAKKIDGSRHVIVFHDDDWMKFRLFASAAPNPAYRAVAQISAIRFRREQEVAVREADMCWFVSPEDLNRVCLPGYEQKCHLIPNGADEAFYSVPDTSTEGSEKVVFVGPPLYEANARSIAWFLESIWPDIIRARPQTKLRLIGLGWDEWLGGPQHQIETPGFVDDLPGELAQASVVVAPLLAGGGTKIKMLEAMAAARPIVCTSIAADGIPHANGLDVADEPQAFAVAVLRWLNDRDAATAAGRANRDAVEGARWTSIWKAALDDVLQLPASP